MASIQVGSTDHGTCQVVPVAKEQDIIIARNAGRELCRRIGFGPTEQVKVATAISELARNIVLYAGRGTIELRVLDGPDKGIEIIARDDGPGIEDLERVFAGVRRSRRGMGLGLIGTKRLMDRFNIVSKPGSGTTVTIAKRLR